MKKALAIILSVLMLGSMLTACSTGKKDKKDSDSTVSTDDNKYDSKGFIKDNLGTLDFEKQTVNILYWSDVQNQEYFAESSNGGQINDIIYSRNIIVELRLNIKLKYQGIAGNSANSANYSEFVNNMVYSDLKDHDIISAHSRTIGLTAVNGLNFNLLETQYLDFDMPWWADGLMEDALINNKLYFCSGDISTNLLYMMYVTFFNKNKIDDFALEDPYKLVEDNKWTIAKMFEMCKNLYEDSDGIPGKSQGDIFGIYNKPLHLDAFLWGADIMVVSKDNSGKMILSEDIQGEKIQSVIELMNGFFHTSNDGYLPAVQKENDAKEAFNNSQTLFVIDRADIVIDDISSNEFEVGIVPVPKYNEDQENFCTLLGNPFSLYAIVINTAIPNIAAAAIECLASESYRQVTPQVFEITMKISYSTDVISAQMYDLVREGVVYDLSRIFWKSIENNIDSLWQSTIVMGNSGRGWTSQIKQIAAKYNNNLETIYNSFE